MLAPSKPFSNKNGGSATLVQRFLEPPYEIVTKYMIPELCISRVFPPPPDSHKPVYSYDNQPAYCHRLLNSVLDIGTSSFIMREVHSRGREKYEQKHTIRNHKAYSKHRDPRCLEQAELALKARLQPMCVEWKSYIIRAVYLEN